MKNRQDDLKEAIYLLKKKQALELKLLKEQVHVVHESIKPANLIKNAFKQVTSAPDLKGNIIDNVIGLVSGFVSKKAFVGGSHNPLTKIAGALLEIGITNVATKNAGTIKSIGEKLAQIIFKKSDKDVLKNSITNN
ncbi:MAG TPA: hypothetical protein VK796_01550 [Cytophaga sp.]|jgi:hypothetical protein|nr:hypothetical protein [Cytophaga sp.]